MRNEKIISIAVICLMFLGCASTGTNRQILEYQKQIDRLEESIRTRNRAVESSIRELETITARSTEMGADIEGIIRELDEYQRAVERLLYNYRKSKTTDNEDEDI